MICPHGLEIDKNDPCQFCQEEKPEMSDTNEMTIIQARAWMQANWASENFDGYEYMKAKGFIAGWNARGAKDARRFVCMQPQGPQPDQCWACVMKREIEKLSVATEERSHD